MKLQDAYVAEAGAMGNWTKIGYNMKNGDTFDYGEGTGIASGEATVLVADLDATNGTQGWLATSKVKLNDCANASTWSIGVYAATSSSEGMVGYKTAVSAKNCSDLTPSFKKLASATGDADEGN